MTRDRRHQRSVIPDSLYSVNSLTGYLQSLGHKAPKASVADYMEWAEDATFLFTVRLFDPALARSNANP